MSHFARLGPVALLVFGQDFSVPSRTMMALDMWRSKAARSVVKGNIGLWFQIDRTHLDGGLAVKRGRHLNSASPHQIRTLIYPEAFPCPIRSTTGNDKTTSIIQTSRP